MCIHSGEMRLAREIVRRDPRDWTQNMRKMEDLVTAPA